MRSLTEILEACTSSGESFARRALALSAMESGCTEDSIRKGMISRLKDMELSVQKALSGSWRGVLVPQEAHLFKEYGSSGGAFSSPFVLTAARISLAVSTYNAAMGRIVAAPTAGSCGILPGLLFSYREHFGGDDETLLSGLIAAAAVGEVTAARATLAGASGGCQAECGAAMAMGAAALVQMRKGSPEALGQAVALAYKSILGLVCDPVGGLVESPCIKRNGMLVSLGALAADMALAGVKSIIPPDEVIDAIGQVGRALPESLRETAGGGLAVTPTARKLVKDLLEEQPE
jgi:L-serine dehydratase